MLLERAPVTRLHMWPLSRPVIRLNSMVFAGMVRFNASRSNFFCFACTSIHPGLYTTPGTGTCTGTGTRATAYLPRDCVLLAQPLACGFAHVAQWRRAFRHTAL